MKRHIALLLTIVCFTGFFGHNCNYGPTCWDSMNIW